MQALLQSINTADPINQSLTRTLAAHVQGWLSAPKRAGAYTTAPLAARRRCSRLPR
jgi:hypothetical protein